ncbi:hypothetical protein HCN44_010136 [Aphidius gifuensis]|uniref:Large ribosomal subunit protein mL64 n=1 Tax=Aphidius gifuensis TaxID=684658 RepID=A0A834XZ62_APHGI|nr:growth arrest and DNA damage-inducible proteins-interacting protein 1 [Aphidius gifuensis]KAF7993541.1 hypothetical protein HCN44_010136 [Aphidius gifuensis]
MNSRVLISEKGIGLNVGIYRLLLKQCYSTKDVNKIDDVDADETPKYLDYKTPEEQEALLKKRNKSNLRPQDRNRIMGVKPYTESMLWIHDTVRFKQRTVGRYGIDSLDVPVGSIWPTKEEIDDKIDYENTGYPLSVQERWKLIEQRHKEAEEKIQKREMEIAKNMSMVDKWQKDLTDKINKKEREMLAAKERKERLVEEVRRQFGFKIDPRDERFKQMIEMKEKEDKKLKKAAKKEERSKKIMAQLMEQSKSVTTKKEEQPKSSEKQQQNE